MCFQRDEAIHQRGGERMLRRQAVTHRHHPATAFIAQAPAKAIMGVEAPRHPTAAVKENHAGQHALRLAQGRIGAQCDRAIVNREQRLARAADRLHARRIHQVCQVIERETAFRRILIAAPRLAGGGQHLQKAPGMAVERHKPLFRPLWR